VLSADENQIGLLVPDVGQHGAGVTPGRLDGYGGVPKSAVPGHPERPAGPLGSGQALLRVIKGQTTAGAAAPGADDGDRPGWAAPAPDRDRLPADGISLTDRPAQCGDASW
jgi:hypothetical protein